MTDEFTPTPPTPPANPAPTDGGTNPTPSGDGTGEVAKSRDNLKKCKCMSCPSYTLGCKMKAMPGMMLGMMTGSDISKKEHLEGLFCAFEPSKCIKDKKGCVCLTCPVATENQLAKQYYCTAEGGE